MAARRLEVLITGDARGAQKAFGDVERAAGGAEKKSGSAVAGIRKKLIGLGAAGLAVGAFKAFDDAQKVGKQTEAVIKSTGGAANKTAKEFGDLADSISRKTGIDDEQIQSSENMLATFTGIRNEVGKGNDIFDQATKAALDMAVAQGQDGVAAAKMLGKALNDPAAGLTKLTRSGVVFTEQQKAQVKALSESGDKLGAQKIILAELNKEFGGSAEAQATSLGKAKVAVDNMAESVGGALAPALEKGADWLSTFASGFSALPVGVQQVTVGITGLGIAAVVAGPKVLSLYRSAQLGIAKARELSAALDSVAATRGVSKATASMGALRSSVAGASTAAGVGGIALLGLGAIAYGLADDEANAAARAAELANEIQSLDQIVTSTGKSIKKAYIQDFLVQAVKENPKLIAGLEQSGSSLEAFAKASTGTNAEFKKYLASLDVHGEKALALKSRLRDLRQAYTGETESVKASRKATEELTDKQDAHKQKTQEVIKKEQEQFQATRNLTTGVQRLAQKYKVIGDNADYAEKKVHDFYDTQTANVSSQIQVERSLDDVAQAFKDNGTALSISAEKGRLNREAIIDSTKAAADFAAQLGKTQGPQAAINAMEQYRLKLDDALMQGGLTRDQVLALNQEMGLTPKDIYTTFGSNSDPEKIKVQGYDGTVRGVPKLWSTVFTADTRPGMAALREWITAIEQQTPIGTVTTVGPVVVPGSRGAPPPGKASGGRVRKGGWNLVGERGPELVKWGASGTVIPARQTANMLSGGGGGNTYITVNLPPGAIVVTPDGLAASIAPGVERALMRKASITKRPAPHLMAFTYPTVAVNVALEMGPNDDPTGGDWTNVAVHLADGSKRILSYSLDRGRNDQTTSFEPGQLVVVLDNSDRMLDPDNADGLVYRGDGKGLPLCPVEVVMSYGGSDYVMFRGLLGPEGWPTTRGRVGPGATVELRAVDRFGCSVDVPSDVWGISTSALAPDWWIRCDPGFPILADGSIVPNRSGSGGSAVMAVADPLSFPRIDTTAIIGITRPALKLAPGNEMVSGYADIMPTGDLSDLTVTLFWRGVASAADQTIAKMVKHSDGTLRWKILCDSSGAIKVTTYDAAEAEVDSVTDSSGPFGGSGRWDAGEAHWIAIRFNSGVCDVWIGGVPYTITCTDPVYESDLYVGGSTDTDASVDEVTLWRRALTDDEINGTILVSGAQVLPWDDDISVDRIGHWYDAARLPVDLDDTEQWHLTDLTSTLWGLSTYGSVPSTFEEGIAQTAEAFGGVAWVTRAGYVRVRDLAALSDVTYADDYATSCATFTDAASLSTGEFRRSMVRWSGTRLDRVVNTVDATFGYPNPSNATVPIPMTITPSDDASVARYGLRRKQVDSTSKNWATVASIADALVARYAEPPIEVEAITLDPAADNDADLLVWLLAECELERMVTVVDTPPVGDPVSTDLQIQRESWQWDGRDGRLLVTLNLALS